MAFVMLNRYLDLSDAMDEPDSSAAVIENSDFADTDVPFDFHIPQRPYVNEDKKEEVSGSGCPPAGGMDGCRQHLLARCWYKKLSFF